MQPQLKQLGLTQLEKALPTLFETARQEQWTYEQFLQSALAAEVEGRDRRAAERRMTAAHLPVVKTDGAPSTFPSSRVSRNGCSGHWPIPRLSRARRASFFWDPRASGKPISALPSR